MVVYSTNPALGYETAFNINASTLIKKGQGMLAVVSVLTAGSTNGSVHDADSIGNASAANQLMTIPPLEGVIAIRCPIYNGIVVVPGTGQVVTVIYA